MKVVCAGSSEECEFYAANVGNVVKERNCKTCIHVNVCNKKENFEKVKKEIGVIKLNDSSSLLEAEDFRAIVNCEYYNEDYNLFSYCNCLKRG